MLKTIFKAVAMSAVAAFFCVGCSDKNNGGGEEPGDNPGEGGGTKTSYTVTFDPSGGTVNPKSAKTDEDGKLATLPTPTRNGYEFDGWYTAQTGGTAVAAGNVYTANTTIYAQWTDVSVGKYTIKFDANGGTVSPTSGRTDNDGVLLIPLPTPIKSGFTFDGWYTSAYVGGGTMVAGSKVFNGDATIYARWSITITFDAGGGTVSPTSRAVDTSGKLASLPNPTRSGYIFEGWYTMAIDGDKISTVAVFDSSSTIYAQWIDVTLTDGRDGKVYNRIRIGTQIWMAKNLNYAADGSECYGDLLASCAKYGRLYDWTTAMDGASSSSESPSEVQGACPVGWHIPSDTEWTVLTNFVGTSAGKKLKARSGWNSSGNGTDDFGFSALPGGSGNSGGSFYDAGYGGYWWSATEGDAGDAWRGYMVYLNEDVFRYNLVKSLLYSVRCLQD